jgi:hypothetical protein
MPVFICCPQSRPANEYITCSRSDRFFANPLPFNETVWNETASFFKTPEITVQQLADARMARLATSKRTNPQHKTSLLADGFSWGECASFFEIMADGTTGTVRKDFIEYWLRESLNPLRAQRLLKRRNKTDPMNVQETSACLLRLAGRVARP